MGEEKDEAIDGKERATNKDLSNPADYLAWEGTSGDFAMKTLTTSKPTYSYPDLGGMKDKRKKV